jgi:uncharacterized protein with HEPN domain
MSLRDQRAWLSDLVGAADLAAKVVARTGTAERYSTDPEARAVIERQVEIIAECLRRLLQDEPGLALIFYEARDIIALRNIISHGYHMLRHAEVYQAVSSGLPSLRSRAADLLAEQGGG